MIEKGHDIASFYFFLKNRVKSYQIKKFGWVNKVDNFESMKYFEASDARNIRIKNNWIQKREWSVLSYDFWWADVFSIQEYKSVLFAFCSSWIYVNNWSWNSYNIAVSSNAKILDTECADSSVIASWTVTDEWTYKTTITLSVSAGDNEWFDKIVKIWDETRRIISNTWNVVVVADPFFKSLNWQGFEIRNSIQWDLVYDWVNACRIFSSHPVITLNTPYFKHVVKYKNRIVWVVLNWDAIYISTLLNWEDFPYILKLPDLKSWDYITGLFVFGNQLVIFANYGVWISEFDNPTEAVIIQRADNFGCVNGDTIDISENILFFLSHRGLEWFNPLETNALEGHMSLSDYKLPEIKDREFANAFGFGFDWKFFLSFPGDDVVYIFDTSVYLKRGEKTFLIDSGYKAKSFAVYYGVLYFSWDNKVFVFDPSSGSDDDSTIPMPYWKSKWITLWDSLRKKVLRSCNISSYWVSTEKRLIISDSTELETKMLYSKYWSSDITLDPFFTSASWFRCKWKKHTITIYLRYIWSSIIENIELLFEVVKR